MDAVRVVPENAEVLRSAFHGRQSAHDLVRVRHAARVGVFRNAPDAFHGGVGGGKALHLVHVRSVIVHGDGNHLDTEGFGHAEMAVVAGHRADPLDRRQRAPRRMAARAERPTAHDGVVHNGQARITKDDNVLGRIVEQSRHERFRFRQAVDHAVVAAVRAVGCMEVGFGIQDIEQRKAQIELC